MAVEGCQFPGQQLVQATYRLVSEALEDVGETIAGAA